MPSIAKHNKKTRRFTRDLDQITADLESPRHLEIYKETKGPEDELPGLGQHYCLECAKWFESAANMEAHQKGKVHKRRVKQLKEGAHTQEEAELATGFGRVDNGKKAEDATIVDEAMEVDEVVT
jgi:bud site selection protein 20